MVESKSQDSKPTELKEAFQVFNDVASQLQATYTALEQRITTLNHQLSAAQEQTLHQLAEKERVANRLKQLLDTLPAGVVVLDGRGMVQESNPAARDLLGPPLSGELWRVVIERSFHADAQSGQEAILKDGRWVSISTCPLGSEPGQIILLMEVTQTRALQAALERYKRLSAMGEMSAKVAHQIRTPLASAILYLSNLNQAKASPQDRQRFLDKALDRMRHLEKVVDDMLTFSRDTGSNLAEVSMEELLKNLASAIETQVEKNSCHLSIRHQDGGETLYINRDAVLGALQNLVNNAIQACGKGGRIEVQTRQVDQHQSLPAIDIIVRDNGPGIPDDAQKHVFEPFFTTRSEGTGLGLAVALSVMQSHGGGLWIESSNAMGTTFAVRLPLIRAHASSLAATQHAI